MYTTDYFIDNVQGVKKQIVNAMVIDSKLKESLNSIIDAQTALAKATAQTGLVAAEVFVKNFAVGSAK